MADSPKQTEVVKTLVDSETKQRLFELAEAADRSFSDYIRWALNLHVYGHGRKVEDARSED